MSTPQDRGGEPGAHDVDPVLRLAPPAELGVLHQRSAHRHHLAATMVDLAARGFLRIIDAGNDPTLGYALDWYLRLPGEQAPTGIDATDPVAVAVAAVRARPAPDPLQLAGVAALRPHERAFLGVVTATPSRLLSRVRAAPSLGEVLTAMTGDVIARGWLRRWPGVAVRTPTGRAVAAQLRAARADLDAHAPASHTTALLLPQAVALRMSALWAARLGQQRPPPPTWFTPGTTLTARGWLGVCNAAAAMAAPPPPGGGAGSAPHSPTGTAGGPWG